MTMTFITRHCNIMLYATLAIIPESCKVVWAGFKLVSGGGDLGEDWVF